MIYRRFGLLFSRLLLQKQDELAELEDLLRTMDDFDNNDVQRKNYLRNRSADEGGAPIPGQRLRKDVLKAIETKVLEYSESNSYQLS